MVKNEEFATLEYFATLSQKIFTDEIGVDGKKIKIKTRAPTIRDLQEIREMIGRNESPFKYAVYLIMRCLIEPTPNQSDIEGWNSGLIEELVKKIQEHAEFGLENEGFLKD